MTRRPGKPIYAVAGIVLVAGAVVYWWGPAAYERILLALDPSAERAFAYGEKHFNAVQSREYDIDRAQALFERALFLDPSMPYVHHELARIAFLRGDLTTAITEINMQIALYGEKAPNSFYIRGLIEGYKGEYEKAARDYEVYLRHDPYNWAAINDYAWVLLKLGKAKESAVATAIGLESWPTNPWLLNSHAIALYEMHAYNAAYQSVSEAQEHLSDVSLNDWLTAYPGNDPASAQAGLSTLAKSIRDNMHTISLAYATSTVQ